MFWVVYNLFFCVVFLIMLPRFALRMIKRGGYRRGFLERFGCFSKAGLERAGNVPRLWIHAVSVGESQLAFRFADHIRKRHPAIRFAFSVTTSTARRLVESRLSSQDIVFYFPLDLPVFLNRIWRIIRPTGIVLTESELWPNVLRMAEKHTTPVVLINGRISVKSHHGYRMLRTVFQKVLSIPRCFCIQTVGDAERLSDIGVPSNRLHVVGTMKYDDTGASKEQIETLRRSLESMGFSGPGRLTLLGGSTWPGEEAALLQAYVSLHRANPSVRLILVPRHAERRMEVASLVRRMGLNPILRSGKTDGGVDLPEAASILLADTTGELCALYACADIVFVGKSLCSTGGQNIIEPAVYGKPIVVGPHMENFPDVIRDFLAAGALVQVSDSKALSAALQQLSDDTGYRMTLGEKARAVVEQNRGTLDRTIRHVESGLGMPAQVD